MSTPWARAATTQLASQAVMVGGPGVSFAQRSSGDHNRARAIDLRQENGVRFRRGGGGEIVLSPGGVRPIDADDDLTRAKAARAHGPDDLFTGGDFLVESDR